MGDHDTADPELEELRREVAELRSALEALTRPAPPSRRALLGMAGAAAAGAVAGLATPAAAANGDNAVLGQSNASTTRTRFTGGDLEGVIEVVGSLHGAPSLRVWASGDAGNAVYASSTNAHAVLALASSDTAAVYGQGHDTVGTGLAGQGGQHGVHGYSPVGVGVFAYSDNGLGLVATGGRAPLRLLPSSTAGPPAAGAHEAGELVVDSVHNLYLCVADGTPGTWRRVGGPSTGSYSPLSPVRVYDSRWPGEAGALASGEHRTISVADARAVADGALAVAGVVPGGAVAVAYNLTAVETTNRGFLAVNPGGVTQVSAAALNWSTTGVVVGNASIASLGNDRELTVVCGGAGAATGFVLDVVGYHS